MTDNSEGLPCRDIVEIVTSYLEGDLEKPLRERFDAHLAICPDCVLYVDQMRQTVALSGASAEPQELPDELRRNLRRAFEDWAAADPGS